MPAFDHWAYTFSLRRIQFEPFTPTTASNAADPLRNLAREAGTVPIERVAHFGNTSFYSDGTLTQNEDDWNDERKTESWWEHRCLPEWPRPLPLPQEPPRGRLVEVHGAPDVLLERDGPIRLEADRIEISLLVLGVALGGVVRLERRSG
ncbi:hypothetical protein [Archangium sp.]|uniref:hypothetical protein n=1 Tax=Archangium sp. TaxID=1872627 RepID=UPI002D30C546|nr:hypothetical protein [Archangium sp.]HYO57114.1 hypothetical protein [Archangium sp.]